MIPISSAMTVAEPFGFTDPFSGSEGWVARYGTQEVSQFRGAELIAEKWGITRDEMEAFARRVARAGAAGAGRGPLRPRDRRRTARSTRDEGPREPNWEKIRSLTPLVEGGRLTAAVAQPDLRRGGRDAHRSASRRSPSTASRRGPGSTT